MSRPRLAVAGLAAGALAATIALGLCACGHSGQTTLHALTSPQPDTVRATYSGPAVRVGAVRLPAELDRIELLDAVGPGRLRVREFDRWAAPPSRLARQALVEDLALRLPAGTVITRKDAGAPAIDVSVEVLSFTPGPGVATLLAVWTCACPPGADVARSSLRLSAPSTGDTPADLSALLSQTADHIATDLDRGVAARCATVAAGS